MKIVTELKRPNSNVCALETTASLLALPVPCVPGPREDVRDQEALGTRMDNFSKIIMKWTRQPDFELLREILAEGPFEQPKVLE